MFLLSLHLPKDLSTALYHCLCMISFQVVWFVCTLSALLFWTFSTFFNHLIFNYTIIIEESVLQQESISCSIPPTTEHILWAGELILPSYTLALQLLRVFQADSFSYTLANGYFEPYLTSNILFKHFGAYSEGIATRPAFSYPSLTLQWLYRGYSKDFRLHIPSSFIRAKSIPRSSLRQAMTYKDEWQR